MRFAKTILLSLSIFLIITLGGLSYETGQGWIFPVGLIIYVLIAVVYIITRGDELMKSKKTKKERVLDEIPRPGKFRKKAEEEPKKEGKRLFSDDDIGLLEDDSPFGDAELETVQVSPEGNQEPDDMEQEEAREEEGEDTRGTYRGTEISRPIISPGKPARAVILAGEIKELRIKLE